MVTAEWRTTSKHCLNTLNNKKKTAQICFHSKIPHTITKMNAKINMDSSIIGSMNAQS
jgi:hypothetical protein